MFRFHKALWGSLAAILLSLAIYCLVGGRAEELTWPERLKAAAGFSAWALGFVAGYMREVRMEKEEKMKKEPIQAPQQQRP